MVYDRKNEFVYINYDDIWEFLKEGFRLKYDEIQELTEEWLGETYNLRGITTLKVITLIDMSWVRHTI